MRIAQVAPLVESVPPKLYGGTERVIAWLTEELVELGHEVTLFASGDSQTSAKLVCAWSRALRLGRPRSDPFAAHTALLEAVAERIIRCAERGAFTVTFGWRLQILSRLHSLIAPAFQLYQDHMVKLYERP